MCKYYLLVCQLPINFDYGDFIEQKSGHCSCFNESDSNGDEGKWIDLENILGNGKLDMGSKKKTQAIGNEF